MNQAPELEAFLKKLGALGATNQRGCFAAEKACSLSRAPGRLDVMGGIADYSGSLVLELPIREAACAAAQSSDDDTVSVLSFSPDGSLRSFEFPTHELASGRASSYASARAFFGREPRDHWAAYLAGVLLVLRLERQVELPRGIRLVLSSDVPEGKGVSSSAAIEVATMRAVAAELGIALSGVDLAILCQKVENLVVGAPCGVMDQMTSACGEAGRLLELLCQPAQILGQVAVPKEVAFFGIDSGVRHAVTGADYGQVRVGAFMGYRMIAEMEGFALESNADAEPARIHDPRYSGYLANVTPSIFFERYEKRLPERLQGREFLERYGKTTDPVTRVESDKIYPVRAATEHPIQEHQRVKAFAELLTGELNTRRLELLGELMYQSHASYSACGLGSEATDQLVRMVREIGPAGGLFGAKITGGGSGGTVAILARNDAQDAVEKLALRYESETGRSAYLFRGSSPGGMAFGVYRASPGQPELRMI